jgi:predicted metal-binding membrane protein
MLPALVPMLWRYHQAVDETMETRVDRLTALVGVGYFFVWTGFGIAAFVLGAALVALAMRSPVLARTVPFAAGAVVAVAGAFQFTWHKARNLTCRTAPAHADASCWKPLLPLGGVGAQDAPDPGGLVGDPRQGFADRRWLRASSVIR